MGEGCARPPDSQETAHTPHAGTQDQTRWTPGPLLAYGRSLRLARLGPLAHLGRDTPDRQGHLSGRMLVTRCMLPHRLSGAPAWRA